MTRARKPVKTTRKRHSEEFKAEVLALVATAGEGLADTGDSALKQIHHRYLGLR